MRCSLVVKVMVLAVCLCLMPVVAHTERDYPHNTDNLIECLDCHYVHGSSLPPWAEYIQVGLDDTQRNMLCWECHDNSTAPYQKTHSSDQTSNQYGDADNDGSPGWSIECKTCHIQHSQEQLRIYGSEGYLRTGTISNIVRVPLPLANPTTQVTVDVTDMVANMYKGMLLVPDTSLVYPFSYNYVITENTNDTITVKKLIKDGGVIANGDSYAVVYGKLIRNIIPTPNSGNKTVKFLRTTETDSYADGDTTRQGICEVCHTQTKNPSTGDARHRNDAHIDSHYEATDCTECHKHVEGFAPTCDICHGYPPTNTTRVFDVLGPPGTGSITGGAHVAHVVTRAFNCNVCHVASVGSGPEHNNNLTITLGFSLFGGTWLGGHYDGQTTVTNGYNTLEPNTTLETPPTGAKTCSNIYCHGRLPDGTVWGGGINTTPQWDASGVNCGDCHGATAPSPPTGGNHTKHAKQYTAGYNYSCDLCHQDPAIDDTLHVNSKSEIIFSSDPKVSGGNYSGTDAALDAYGSCTNVYCHSTVQSSPPGSGPVYSVTPAWGGSIGGCVACHKFSGAGLNSGSHEKHFFSEPTDECYACHNLENSDDPCFSCHNDSDFYELRKKHANYSIDVAFAPKFGGSYSGSSIPGDAYGQCSSVYCHGADTPTWGGTLADAGECDSCHGGDALSTGSPGFGPMTLVNHPDHMNNAGIIGTNYDCAQCHDATVDIGDNRTITGSVHADGTKDVVFNIAGTWNGSDTCTSVYCHSSGKGAYVDPDTWGSATDLDCKGCHGTTGSFGEPDYANAGAGLADANSHPAHVSAASDCNKCHTDTTTTGTAIKSGSTLHTDQSIDVTFDTSIVGALASFLPGIGNKTCSSVYCHGTATPQWGAVAFNCDGCHKANNTLAGMHGQHYETANVATSRASANNSTSAEYIFNCGVCHYNTNHGGGVVSADQAAEVLFDGVFAGGSAAHAAGGLAGSDIGFNYTDATCSTIYCHGDYPGSGLSNSPTVTGSVACGDCHGASNSPDSFPDSGSHEKHVDSDFDLAGLYNRQYACTLCHEGIVGGTGPSSYSIADKSRHVSGDVDWGFDTSDSRVSGSSIYSIVSGTQSPSDGTGRAYGTCDNVYCHSIVQTSTGGALTGLAGEYKTPTWGTSLVTCGNCHASDGSSHMSGAMASGSHTKHLSYKFTTAWNGRKCNLCHKYDTTATNDASCTGCHNELESTYHVNGVVDILFDTSFVGATAQYDDLTNLPGDGYDTCSNTYCHGNYNGSGLNATPTWGTAASAACGTCHKAKNNDVLTSGSHQRHAGSGQFAGTIGTQNEREYACAMCHKDIVGGSGPDSYSILSTVMHVNKVVDWKFDTSDSRLAVGTPSYGIATGTQPPSDGTTPRAFDDCSNVYCHSNVQADGGVGAPSVYTDPAWGAGSGCWGCHVGDPATPSTYSDGDPANATEIQTRHLDIHSGSHNSHSGVISNPIDCMKCHRWDPTATGTQSGCRSGQCHGDAVEKTLHANGGVDVIFGTSIQGTYNGTSAPGDVYGDCSNTYCHSGGTSKRSGVIPANTSPVWGTSGALTCQICHGNSTYADWRAGMPDYVNGSPKENSHVDHIIDQTGIDNCSFCHPYTTLNGISINDPIYHTNSFYNANYEDVSHGAGGLNQFANRDVQFIYLASGNTRDTGTQSSSGYCSANTCHGYSNYVVFNETKDYIPVKSTTYWGEYVTCGDCHLIQATATGITGAADIDSYSWGDGQHAAIDNDQWTYSGHGRTSGTYDVSGNPAANFDAAANCTEWFDNFGDAIKFPDQEARCDECLYCHDDSAPHDVQNNSANFFRLANYDALARGEGGEWNDVCLVCHATGSSGYDPDSVGDMNLKNATVKVDKYHYGSKHDADHDGGSVCWDCHDPHGDRTADADSGGNIYMTHKDVVVDKDDANSDPLIPASTASPVFTANTTGTDYANSSTFDGICNVCHTGANHYTSTSGDGHESSRKCVVCHSHSIDTAVDGDAFKPGAAGQGHETHLNEAYGPGISCADCHGSNLPPLFADGNNLANTTVCDNCHSPSGSYDGVNSATIGAKNNWPDGVYNGTILASGKEMWCAGCHDEVPANSKQDGTGDTALNIIGNNSSYGYYVGGHGKNSGNYTLLSWQYTTATGNPAANRQCRECHNLTAAHFNNSADRLKTGYENDIDNSNCKQCHNPGTVAVGDPQWYTTYTDYVSSAHEAVGNLKCSACHDVHDASGNYRGMTKADQESLCYQCHTEGVVQNNAISGAGLADDIQQAFGLANKHDLGTSFTISSMNYSLECASCHNVHIVNGKYGDASSGKSPVTRFTNNTSVWGDGAGEKMSDYTDSYQAPYSYNSKTTYEPDGSATQDGSNLTDFVTFCTDCHNVTDTIYSTALGRDLKAIDWNNEKHGKGNADGSLCGDAPYPSGSSGLGKVLSCTDCHEPHGSPNAFLARNVVNGGVLAGSIGSFSTTDWNYLCNRCHKDDNDINSGCDTNKYFITHHQNTGCNSDRPYDSGGGGGGGGGGGCTTCHSSGGGGGPASCTSARPKIICTRCHFHGSDDSWAGGNATGRRTF